jgi:hypothetical protein
MLFTHKDMKKTKNIYVIELDESVKTNKKFAKANPNPDPALPCLYVGRTGRTPKERFQNHKDGYKSSGIVKRFGIKLRPDLYEHLNPMTFEEVEKMEETHAEALRAEGYPVWQK